MGRSLVSMVNMAGRVPSVDDAALTEAVLGAGAVTRAQLEYAENVRQQSASRLEDVLVGLGFVSPDQLREALAQSWGIPSVDLSATVRDDVFMRRWPARTMLDEAWVPFRALSDGSVLVATALRPDAQRRAAIEATLGAPVVFSATTPWDIRNLVLRVFRRDLADRAANRLYRRNPELSARKVLSRGQAVGMVLALLVIVALLILWPVVTVTALLTLISLVFLVSTLFKFAVSMLGARFDVVEKVGQRQVQRLDDRDLPTYSVLVPVFREANIVAQLVQNLGRLDYPPEKLEVLVLVEEGDTLTREAVQAANPPANFHIVLVPEGQPQTKPRACNVGLYVATGEYLVIYDAEDEPDPDQLKKALVAFRRGGDETVCVQASLNYFNADENLLTRMFTLEYSYWFDYMLAGLDAAGLPIPLGGTSNHFRTAALVELGGWDPYNVTEDADLGIRASAMGYRVGVVNSTTLEEANTSIPNFIRQRSRWIKGYIQTALVHARRPAQLIGEIGLVPFLSFVLLIAGTPATFLSVIPLYLLTAVAVFLPQELREAMPGWLLWVSLVNFSIGNTTVIYLSMLGPYKRGDFTLILWSLLNPLYWILHSIASYKAVWQLITKPHYWEKTEHGLTKRAASS